MDGRVPLGRCCLIRRPGPRLLGSAARAGGSDAPCEAIRFRHRAAAVDMATDRQKRLALIRDRLGAEMTDERIEDLALNVLAEFVVENGVIPTPQYMTKIMVHFASHAVSSYAGRLIDVVPFDTGHVAFKETDEPYEPFPGKPTVAPPTTMQ